MKLHRLGNRLGHMLGPRLGHRLRQLRRHEGGKLLGQLLWGLGRRVLAQRLVLGLRGHIDWGRGRGQAKQATHACGPLRCLSSIVRCIFCHRTVPYLSSIYPGVTQGFLLASICLPILTQGWHVHYPALPCELVIPQIFSICVGSFNN